MRVSLNLIKKYVDLPKKLSNKDIAYDLTLRTVEVDKVEDVSLKYHDIVFHLLHLEQAYLNFHP